MMGKTEGLFAVLVVWSINFALVKNRICDWCKLREMGGRGVYDY